MPFKRDCDIHVIKNRCKACRTCLNWQFGSGKVTDVQIS